MKRKIILLSNVTVDMIATKLQKKYEIYTPPGFNSWKSEIFNTASPLYSYNADGIFILLDATESQTWEDYPTAMEKIGLWGKAIEKLVENISQIPIFISTIDIRMNRILPMSNISCSHTVEEQWIKIIKDVIKCHNNCFVYDFKDAIVDIGRKVFYSEKMWYMGNMPFSRDGIQKISDDIDCLINNYYVMAKKVIVLDLDNTLWGGVFSEDGIDGIELSDHKEGQRFYDFQRQLLEMKNQGILLTINSKNNVADIKQVFDEHPHMLLKWDDFVAKKINWKSKAQNIKELITELNLTESSFVFVDDNPIEREIVLGECPEVTVLDFPKDTTRLISFAEDFYCHLFRQPRVLNEDVNKTEMYFSEKKRRLEKSESLDINTYIKKLEMEADIHLMTDQEIQRVAQLCNKTNQFNITTKRYTEKDIAVMDNNPNIKIFTVHSSDKYGKYGLVSLFIAKETENTVDIDTFLMSCRVMGRNLERVIVNEILEDYKIRGFEKITANYIPTAKNIPVKDLFEQLGFDVYFENKDIKKYELNLTGWKKAKENTYKTIHFLSDQGDK